MGQILGEMSFELSCPVQTGVLSHIRGFVVGMATEVEFNAEDLLKIELAVDEACSNVIEHAYQGQLADEDKKLQIRVVVFENGIKIMVFDNGLGIKDNEIHKTTNMESYVIAAKHRGLGTFIITNFMDEVYFHTSQGDGTVVEMTKYLHKK